MEDTEDTEGAVAVTMPTRSPHVKTVRYAVPNQGRSTAINR